MEIKTKLNHGEYAYFMFDNKPMFGRIEEVYAHTHDTGNGGVRLSVEYKVKFNDKANKDYNKIGNYKDVLIQEKDAFATKEDLINHIKKLMEE